MKSILLSGEWRLTGKREGSMDAPLSLTATVPGMVQLDLSRAGILPSDLYMGMNITETEKYEDYEWWYERTFTAPEERKRVFLVFRGVDCVAEYFLNGKKFGESDNMFITHEFDVSEYLIDGENTLTVHITSPTVHTHSRDYDIFNIAVSWRDTPVNTFIRRAPHTYGWDIMPRCVTSGLWRDVILEVRDKIYFKQTFFNFSFKKLYDYTDDSYSFSYVTESEWEDFKDVEMEFDAVCGDSRIHHRFPVKYSAGRYRFRVANPKLWWPRGYGEPNVYDATLRIYSCGELVHEKKTSFGIRTVELQRTDSTDGKNGYFRFVINGVEVMCKGTNWVPLDAFHSRDAERYDAALDLLYDSGSNIIRCWGGNVYEDHKLFDFCDRHGIMVWQDFAMACNNYPEKEEFFEKMRREAEAVIRELRHHPSLILWSGDNEIDCMMKRVGSQPSKNRITREVIPEAVYKNDVGRPYLASSPYVSDEVFFNPHLDSPEEHLWGRRDYHKSDFHKQSRYHFVSETGYHGCPSLESIKKFITPEKVWPYQNNSEWNLHSTDQNDNPARVMLMDYQVRQMFRTVPTDPEEYILASQISQAEAKKYFIERMRMGRPNKSGIIWWNLLDGWPQMSDAVVDYYFDKKLAYYYIKRSQKPFIIALDELYDRAQKIFACNDTMAEINGHYRIIDGSTDKVLIDRDFTAAPNTSTHIGNLPMEYSYHTMLIIEWEANGERGFNHYTTGFIPYDLERYKEWLEKYGLRS